jgi:hypothetical protein
VGAELLIIWKVDGGWAGGGFILVANLVLGVITYNAGKVDGWGFPLTLQGFS